MSFALQDDDTQYQYRKRKAEQERLQSPEKTQQPDARVEKALCVTSVMKKIMKLTKEDLKTERQKKLTDLFYFTCISSLHHDNLHNYFSTTFYIA
jgi:hypothetical protein